MSGAWLFWGLMFGAIGFGFFIYGRKQKAAVPLVCGLSLMIIPYFVSNIFVLVTIGFALIVACYFIRA
jgi:predicted membrane protein